jgi:hypothetical protein
VSRYTVSARPREKRLDRSCPDRYTACTLVDGGSGRWEDTS